MLTEDCLFGNYAAIIFIRTGGGGLRADPRKCYTVSLYFGTIQRPSLLYFNRLHLLILV